MALKYRIVYDHYSRYQKKQYYKWMPIFLLVLLLCAAILLSYYLSPGEPRLYDVFLPGDPAVTTDAFMQLSDALDRGETLRDAWDAFCYAVLEVR